MKKIKEVEETSKIQYIEDILCNMGFGDDFDKPYYGYNFTVLDKLEED